KLPPALTESLAMHLLRKGEIKGLGRYEFQCGGNEADIIGRYAQTRLRIEVKGTTKGFEYFGEKDIHSDYLLWFDFADLLRKNNGDGHLRLYVVAQPGSHFDKPVKIVISRLKEVARNGVIALDYRLSSPLCTERFQLKSARNSFSRTALGANYDVTMEVLLRDAFPSLILLHYNRSSWIVEDLFVVHRACITTSCIIPRSPLSSKAKRRG